MYKKLVVVFSFFLFCFVTFHLIMWFSVTKQIFARDDNSIIGDLARVSYRVDYSVPRKMEVNLSKKHIDPKNWKREKFEIFAIGDSFSYGNGGGKNPYYQDYLTTYYDKKLLNARALPGKGMLETVIILANNGFFEKYGVKYVLLQSVERSVISRFSRSVNFHAVEGLEEVEDAIVNYHVDSPAAIKFINKMNYNALLYNILYKFDDNAYFSKSYITDLNQTFFHIPPGNRLMFFYEDIMNTGKSTLESVKKMNENLNELSKLLEGKNIRLIFIPTVDKYDLYSDYIVNNPYPKNNFFELFRELPKNYQYIDTKKILRTELSKGVQDLYWYDDSHWNSKAIETVVKHIVIH